MNPDGYLLPFHLDTRTTSAQKIPSTSHAWDVQHDSWNGGKMDNWLPAHRKAEGAKAPYVMGYHTRADIPFQFALAEAFTICDRYHCSVMGPDLAQPHVLDDRHDRSRRRSRRADDEQQARFRRASAGRTYAERLEKAGVSWKVYQQQDNYGCNMLEYFKNVSGGRPRLTAVQPRHDSRAGRQVRIRRHERQPADRVVDHYHQHQFGASRFHAGRRRGVRRQQDQRHRRQPGSLGENRVHSQLRRERRHLRPRAAAGAARPARRRNSSTACRSAAASACRASSSRRGPPAAGCAASRSTTRRCCSSWKSSPA